MSRRKIALACALYAFFTILVLNQTITQMAAWGLLYANDLGSPIFGNIYFPWEWIGWWQDYGDIYPGVFDRSFKIGKFITLLLVFLPIVVIAFRPKKAVAIYDLHGSAKFAEKEEIEQMGLLESNKDGVFIGGWNEKLGRGPREK